MTNERAIEILKNLEYIKVLENNVHNSKSDCKKDNDDYSALQMAIQALKYRTPKKPIEDNLSYSGYKCPTCKCNIMKTRSHEMENTPFCIWCGQALDWT